MGARVAEIIDHGLVLQGDHWWYRREIVLNDGRSQTMDVDRDLVERYDHGYVLRREAIYLLKEAGLSFDEADAEVRRIECR